MRCAPKIISRPMHVNLWFNDTVMKVHRHDTTKRTNKSSARSRKYCRNEGLYLTDYLFVQQSE
jgi:hypothetical protein